MPITRHYEAIDSQGISHKRESVRREYTHAVVYRGNCTYGDKAPFTAVEWASRQDLADKNASAQRRKAHVSSVEVIEARMVRTSGKA